MEILLRASASAELFRTLKRKMFDTSENSRWSLLIYLTSETKGIGQDKVLHQGIA
jgi:hypothetical protein